MADFIKYDNMAIKQKEESSIHTMRKYNKSAQPGQQEDRYVKNSRQKN